MEDPIGFGVAGSATYLGNAAGMFSRKGVHNGETVLAEVDHFIADVELNVDFARYGAMNSGDISGTIDNFQGLTHN